METLYTCPLCKRKNFSLQGIKVHRCTAKSRRRMTPTGPLQYPPLDAAELARAGVPTTSSK